MTQDSDRFAAYVAKAGEGPNSLPRIVLAIALVLVVWVAGSMVVIFGGAMLVLVAQRVVPGMPTLLTGLTLGEIVATRTGLALQLLSIASIWPALWLALRLLHKRRLSGLLGAADRISRADFRRGLVVAVVLGAVSIPLWLLADPHIERGDISPAQWLAALLPFAACILLQSSAEELLFRGYLPQALGHRFRSPWIWAALPALAFMLMHWNASASAWMNAAGLITVGGFGVSAAILAWRTGDLGAAMGLHFGNNLMAILVVGSAGPTGEAAFFTVRNIADPSWTPIQAAGIAAGSVATTLLALAVLLHPRSPLRVAGVPPAH
ncbi:MAG: CPBP family intramembrane metalloprotease [Mesorhizobium sp.]|nr:CPBP family intramembrane metalloprotease [Mesorhizobium sp.]